MNSPEWKTINTAPPWERIMVCGWQPPSDGTDGYWWWHEDITGPDGDPSDHPSATHWAPIILPDRFPSRNATPALENRA